MEAVAIIITLGCIGTMAVCKLIDIEAQLKALNAAMLVFASYLDDETKRRSGGN